jgi:hypothetical protein
MQYENVEALLEWLTPTDCEEIAGFRGLAGYLPAICGKIFKQDKASERKTVKMNRIYIDQ